MLKTMAMTIVFTAFAWTAGASNGTQNPRPAAATSAKNILLAQQGGVFCRKGTRYDGRQRTCVPE